MTTNTMQPPVNQIPIADTTDSDPLSADHTEQLTATVSPATRELAQELLNLAAERPVPVVPRVPAAENGWD